MWVFILISSLSDSSDENRFVVGSKDGHVTIWTKSSPKSTKLFNNSEQWKNATFVKYANKKIFAIGKSNARLHILDLKLNTLKKVDHQFEREITAMESSSSFVAIGEACGNVSIFDNNGDLILVSHFWPGKSLFQNYKHGNSVYSISINGDTVASGSFDETCQVWSVSKNKKLYSVKHNSWINHVHLLPDQKLKFDLITCSDDKTVKLWRRGRIVKSLQQSDWCYHFDLDKDHRLLAVATGFDVNGSVSVYRLDTFAKIYEKAIGSTSNVRFNKNATKLIAASFNGSVYEISLQ